VRKISGGIEQMEANVRNSNSKMIEKQPGWKTIGVKVRVGELPLLNRQLARFNYNTLGDLA
jgi:hypothetical protein